LGYMEAFVKLLAIGVAIASLSIFNSADRQLSPTRIAQIVILAVIGALYLAMIVLRVFDKELFALVLIGKFSFFFYFPSFQKCFYFAKRKRNKFSLSNNLFQSPSRPWTLDYGASINSLGGSRRFPLYILLPHCAQRIHQADVPLLGRKSRG
jgi:hypothetical protein